MDALMLVSQESRRADMTVMNRSAELIARVRSGDDEAFRLIFDRYARPLMSFIYDMVGQRELAEELAQETFVRAYRGIHALKDDTKLSTWLFGIAKNVARESLRSKFKDHSRVEMEDEGVTQLSDKELLPDDQLINKELNGVIQTALACLDADKREVFTLKVFQQRSYEEI